MSTRIKVNYLIKEELIYELILRNIEHNPQQTVEELRKLLRAEWNRPTDFKYFHNKINVSSELQTINDKLIQVQFLIDKFREEKNGLLATKIQFKVEHLQNRFSTLRKVKLSDIHKSQLDEMSTLYSQRLDEFKELRETVPAEEVTHVQNLLEQSLDQDEDMEAEFKAVQQPITASTPVQEKIKEAMVIPQDSRMNRNEGEVPQVHMTVTNRIPEPQVSGVLFHKIQNPVEKLLNHIPTCNGLNVPNLLKFLRGLLRVRVKVI